MLYNNLTFQITSVDPFSVNYYQRMGWKWAPQEGYFIVKVEDTLKTFCTQ